MKTPEPYPSLPGLEPPRDPVPRIEGLRYCPEVFSPGEQHELLVAADAAPWRTDLSRQVQHYGLRYDYQTRSLAEGAYAASPTPLPDWLEALAKRVKASAPEFPKVPDQVIINNYEPGQGIALHTDRECFGPVVATLSLGDTWNMDLEQGGRKEQIGLEPGSLLVLGQAARWRWRHGIAKRQSDVVNGIRCPRRRRVSLTFRTIAEGNPGRSCRTPADGTDEAADGTSIRLRVPG